MEKSSPRKGPARLALSAAILLLSMGGGTEADAQVGAGNWKQYFPTVVIQERGAGAVYTKADGIETFRMAPGDERCEARVQDDYKSGIRQFEGYVNVTAGEGTCVHQVFKFLMIVAYGRNGGELRQHSSMSLGTTQAYGRWIRINTIHDADRRVAEVWVDGVLKLTFPAGSDPGGPNGWYHKYGIYNGGNVRPQSQWKDIRYWEKSNSPLLISRPSVASAPSGTSLGIYNLKGECLLTGSHLNGSMSVPSKTEVASGIHFLITR